MKQIQTTLDEYVYTPDDQLIEGEVETGKRYEERDFNKIIEIKEREAYRVKLFMDAIDQRQKTLAFCATQLHALAVRDLINQLKASQEPNYCAPFAFPSLGALDRPSFSLKNKELDCPQKPKHLR